MTIETKIISVLSLILKAKRLRTNNQKCIDCLKPRSNKNECEYKKCGCNYFYVSNY